MQDKKEKLEDFKTAITSTVKSVSNSQNIEVTFGNQSFKSEKNSIAIKEIINKFIFFNIKVSFLTKNS